MSHELVIAIAFLLMLPGLAGVLLPALPGIPYMFLIALGFGVVDKFEHLSGVDLAILLLIAAVSLVVDYFSGIWGARWGGASAKSTAAGFIGLLAGTLLFPPLGGFIGMFLGILYVESKQKEVRFALKAASGSVLGSLAGIVANFFLALTFLLVFVLLAR